MVASRILRNKIGTLSHLSAHHHVHYSSGPPKSGPAVSASAGVPPALGSPPTLTSLPYNHLYQSHFPPYSPPLSSPTKSGRIFWRRMRTVKETYNFKSSLLHFFRKFTPLSNPGGTSLPSAEKEEGLRVSKGRYILTLFAA